MAELVFSLNYKVKVDSVICDDQTKKNNTDKFDLNLHDDIRHEIVKELEYIPDELKMTAILDA